VGQNPARRPLEGHGWLKVENRLDFWGRAERFLDQNLNGAPAAH
jgi:hypothetical protein